MNFVNGDNYLLDLSCAVQHLINTIQLRVPMGEIDTAKRLAIEALEKMEVNVTLPKIKGGKSA